MNIQQRRLQRVLIFLPGLLMFYWYVLQTKLYLVYGLIAIQVLTHLFLVYSGKQCTPQANNICNRFALWIGILFTGVVIYHRLGIIPLFISLYMIVSHLVTIYPLNGTFIYKELELPLFDSRSFIFIYCDLFHETKLSSLLDQYIQHTDGCIIDAGAYIGDSFLLLAKKYPHRSFYMIEPSTVNADFIDRIKPDNVIVWRHVLSDSKKRYQSIHANQPNASYIETDEEDAIHSVSVDELLTEKVGVMHYDVEGMELEVVKGAMRLIQRDKPIVIVESLGKDRSQTLEIQHLLEPLGYTPYIVHENCNALDILDQTKCRNVVFLPKV